jgi:hypothetical protein
MVLLQKITLTSFHGKWDDYDITFMIMVTIKYKRLKYIECTNKRDELYDVPTCCTKFLKYDPSWHWIKNIHYVQLKKTQSRWKFRVHLMLWIIASQPHLIANLCGNKCVAKASWNWKHKVWLVNRYNVSFNIMEHIPPEGLVMVKSWAIPSTCAI